MAIEATTQSRLAKFPLTFEYDKTLREIKKHTKLRSPVA